MDEGGLLDMAARAALRGMGAVEPNPMVGCVMVDPRGRVIGVGHHRRYGSAHAESECVSACRRAGYSTEGCAVLCTLEPCGHVGKTDPCADLLVESGVASVVCARREPTSLAGGGAEKLRAAGVDVRFSDASRLARLVGAPFAKRVERGLPWVVAKWAQTVDGGMTTGPGGSGWISNEHSRRRVHVMRGRVDAVVVGIGTVLADDPMLTARGVPVRRVARRVVLDSGLRIPLGSALVGSAREVPLTVFAARSAVEGMERVAAMRERGVEVIGVGVRDGRIDAREALGELVRRHGSTRVLVEAGGTLLGALMEEGLVDEAHVHVGGLAPGDTRARAVMDGEYGAAVEGLGGLMLWRAKELAGDVLLTYGREEEGGGGAL